ncbi:PhoX family phosphatase [Thioalkalivibrio sp. XN8]|uniref:PhoX family protein n=1 Tax=Thioalkalivibrio sp. XN8 TaxID=2712863 RepID=UPI0013EAE5B2|nr:PhoX family phosphatase [Thioalkalivibrio sp. XN8]NGP51999.1 PhoX family phosphatase [Thioalkalivibrio sp. XN8]
MHDHDNEVSNPSKNRPFRDVLEVSLSRRKMLMGSLATAATAYVATSSVALAGNKGWKYGKGGKSKELIGFKPVTIAEANDVGGKVPLISPDYQYQTLISWGEKVNPRSPVQPYNGEPERRPKADEQAELIGIGHDGMTLFPVGKRNRAGMLCINHEFGRNSHVLGKPFPESLEDVRVSQHAHGVSVVALAKIRGRWRQVWSRNARRIHVNTPVEFSGPAAGHPLLQTPAGNPTLGTVNNCSNGETPWGTYLTCEENFNGYFGASDPNWAPTDEQARYGFTNVGFGYGWHVYDERFDLSDPNYKNEDNRFGWVVEIDPRNGRRIPVKRTALGRFKHEGAEVVVGKGGRLVVYMGDDQSFDYIYKFVSDGNWKSMRARGMNPLDHGKLYVAKFKDDGTGDWLELTIDNPVLAARFKDQAEVLVYTRLAADLLGATPMDRPEWASVAPNGDVYCTLTNNRDRTEADAANPLAPNPDGHIIRWRDDHRHVGTRFVWDIYLIAQDTHGEGDERNFSDPDGIWVDPDGRVFIQTDGGQKAGLQNQMVVADPDGIDIRRLFVGVSGDEITGIAYTPDRRTMFINTQHPGNGDPTRTNFPAAPDGVTIPRDTTFVITRKDGGMIGS